MTINNTIVNKDMVIVTMETKANEIKEQIKEQIKKLTTKTKINTINGTMIDYEEVLGFRA